LAFRPRHGRRHQIAAFPRDEWQDVLRQSGRQEIAPVQRGLQRDDAEVIEEECIEQVLNRIRYGTDGIVERDEVERRRISAVEKRGVAAKVDTQRRRGLTAW
jgi:hypothetical protein